ncbi:MAG: hemerythrin domain-containing protein [Acidimicrobiales bacterium]
MCSYCGCDAEALLAELMAEHEQISLLARQATAALDRGDRTAAVAVCGEIASLFRAHGAKEESGLFAELRGEGLAVDSVVALEREHRELEVGIARLAGDDLAAIRSVLAQLMDHADRESTDLFPMSVMLLSNSAWSRISRTQEYGKAE